MPAPDSPAILVARFLKSNNYNDTLTSFLHEAGLPPDAGSLSRGSLTIEKILEEKKLFDLSVEFEKLGTEERKRGWSKPAPSRPHLIQTLPSSSNLLSVAVERLQCRDGQDDVSRSTPFILATSADRRLNIVATASGHQLTSSLSSIHDSPILSTALIGQDMLLSAGMSGQLVLSNTQGEALCRRRDHTKYVVKVVTYHDKDNQRTWVATAGWDHFVHIYIVDHLSDVSSTGLKSPHATLSVSSNPESILLLSPTLSPDTENRTTRRTPILLLTRRDSTHLWYYRIPPPASNGISPVTLDLLGNQNLAPHSSTWIAFTPSCLALSPTSPNIVAIATNTVPHMKLLIVKLLVPSSSPSSSPSPDPSPTSIATPGSPRVALPSFTASASTLLTPNPQAAQARAALAKADTDAAAILIHANTLAPQTPYSTPVVVWRPDGSGVWVNGDDGAIRGLEVDTGKVVAVLENDGGRKGGNGEGEEELADGGPGGHEVGSKVRCLWAGWVPGDEDWDRDGHEELEEWVVSGGFDRRLIVWKVS